MMNLGPLQTTLCLHLGQSQPTMSFSWTEVKAKCVQNSSSANVVLQLRSQPSQLCKSARKMHLWFNDSSRTWNYFLTLLIHCDTQYFCNNTEVHTVAHSLQEKSECLAHFAGSLLQHHSTALKLHNTSRSPINKPLSSTRKEASEQSLMPFLTHKRSLQRSFQSNDCTGADNQNHNKEKKHTRN